MARRWHIRTSGDEGAWHHAQGVSGLPDLCHFTSKPMFLKRCKDILRTHQQSNMIYLFLCWCGCRYVRKTTQRSETLAKQHAPASLLRPTKEDEHDDKNEDEDGTDPKTKTKSSTSSIASICWTMWNVWKVTIFTVLPSFHVPNCTRFHSTHPGTVIYQANGIRFV